MQTHAECSDLFTQNIIQLLKQPTSLRSMILWTKITGVGFLQCMGEMSSSSSEQMHFPGELHQICSHKKTLQLAPPLLGVNFANILHAAFVPTVLRQ
jgi:hypothetical protein